LVPRDVGRAVEAVAGNSRSSGTGRAASGPAARRGLRGGRPCGRSGTGCGSRSGGGSATFTAGASGARAAAGRPHRDRLWLAAERQQVVSLGIELDDVARSLIHHPDVVLRVDPHLLREVEAVDPDADLTDVLAA